MNHIVPQKYDELCAIFFKLMTRIFYFLQTYSQRCAYLKVFINKLKLNHQFPTF